MCVFLFLPQNSNGIYTGFIKVQMDIWFRGIQYNFWLLENMLSWQLYFLDLIEGEIMINQYDKVIQKRASVMLAEWTQIQEQEEETPLSEGKSGKDLSAVYPVWFDLFK